ncbi:MAG: tail fiber protein [Bacteroidales bacterium]|nr:tail fiber protein [Bacteroidales bacterium]
MKISNLITNEVNQNDYHFNKLTRNKIGFLYIAPVNIVPDDCLACDGYVLKIIDYKKLHSVIGTYFNTGGEAEDEFRIPDYNITHRFLQPSKEVGVKIEAGLPNITGDFTCRSVNASGCFTSVYSSAGQAYWNNVNNDPYHVKKFNASLSNVIYGNSNTVQPPSQNVHICIKYK